MVLVQAQVEKLLNRFIPKAVNLVFVPMLTFLIMGTLALAVLGPIGNFLGGYLSIFFNFLSVNASWAPAVLIGAFLPPMVMFGLHNGVAPLGVMQMADLGYDSIFGPGCVCSNIAQRRRGPGGGRPHQGHQAAPGSHLRRHHRPDEASPSRCCTASTCRKSIPSSPP